MFLPGAGGYEPYSYNQGGTGYDDQSFDSYISYSANAAGTLKPGERFNAKIPPSYVGGSFFAYMEDVEDWETLSDADVKKRGPLLKNALSGPLML